MWYYIQHKRNIMKNKQRIGRYIQYKKGAEMLFLVIIALLVNMDSIVYFFEIPYQVVDMGGTQDIVSGLNVLHSSVYVVISAIASRKIAIGRYGAGTIRFLVVAISAIYIGTCFTSFAFYLYFFVFMHGSLLGIFWPVFWSAFYQEQKAHYMKMSTLSISSAICSVAGPILAGHIYSVCGRYVLLLFAGLTIAAAVSWKAAGKFALKQGDRNKENMRYREREGKTEFIVLPDVTHREGMRVMILMWMGMTIAGYLEGIFRSAMAIFLLKYSITSDVWGTMQSVKLLAQTFVILVIRLYGEEGFVFRKTKFKLLSGMACFVAGTVSLLIKVSVSTLIISMVFLGIGYGIIYFLCMTAGTKLTGFLNQNLNGTSECLTGVGILLGSAANGIFQENPYVIFIILVSVGTVLIQTAYRTNIWNEIEKK